jgi:predicted phage baseplate assembly protein
VRNPLPASGGTDPEPLANVRLYAPQAFRTQERAVTEADYADVAGRHPEVQKAAATLRWTGSWYTVFVTVDRKGGRPVDATFKSTLRTFLDRYRLAGYDLEIESPVFIPLDIALSICVSPGYLKSSVEAALFDAFSTANFFNPDNFTFGQPLYLSQLIARALRVAGVISVDTTDVEPNRFQRQGSARQPIPRDGELRFDRLEIPQVLTDSSRPEAGRIQFFLTGGL